MTATIEAGTTVILTITTADPTRVVSQLEALGEAATFRITSVVRKLIRTRLVIEVTAAPAYELTVTF